MTETTDPAEAVLAGETAEEFAARLIAKHSAEGRWDLVAEDYQWLGLHMEQAELNRNLTVLADRRDELEEWLRRQPPVNIWTGEDPCDPDVALLVTHWPDGSATIAVRRVGDRTWGPPHPLAAQPVT